MIFDAIPFREISSTKNGTAVSKAISSFIDFLERKINVRIIYDLNKIYFGRDDMVEPLILANLLLKKGVIRSFFLDEPLADEPPVRYWSSICNGNGHRTGGISIDDDSKALMAALAEGIERHIWYSQTDFLSNPIRATEVEISKHGSYIAPKSFVAFSDAQRKQYPKLFLNSDASYIWTRAKSLVSDQKIYLPAQVTMVATHPLGEGGVEPLIREKNTIGLATWPTMEGAHLRGILEVVEREAYMIMWFNQLTLPRIEARSLTERSHSLHKLVTLCEKYRLKVHVIRMITDAPTHAIAVVLEDMSTIAPRFVFGLSAHESITKATEHAILEALRARRIYRNNIHTNTSILEKSVDQIGHIERIYYWGKPENAQKLEFLIRGEIKPYRFDEKWDSDTPTEHLSRLIRWSKEKKFECLSVSLGKSKANPTPWYVEMVVMPDLQPVHLNEWNRHLGGIKRLKEIPTQFGYTPLKSAFTEEPHPYI